MSDGEQVTGLFILAPDRSPSRRRGDAGRDPRVRFHDYVNLYGTRRRHPSSARARIECWTAEGRACNTLRFASHYFLRRGVLPARALVYAIVYLLISKGYSELFEWIARGIPRDSRASRTHCSDHDGARRSNNGTPRVRSMPIFFG